MRRLSPKYEALAFRVWAFCQEREWNVTCDEIAEDVGLGRMEVVRLLAWKRWGGRVRATRAKFTCSEMLNVPPEWKLQAEARREMGLE